jgi:uncharacterized membrane protein
LLKAPASSANWSQPISQSTAIVLIVLILGASFYLWWTHHLRSRAGLIAIAMVVVALAYFAISTPAIGT